MAKTGVRFSPGLETRARVFQPTGRTSAALRGGKGTIPNMADFIEPTGSTPSLASELSERTLPSFGSDDTEAGVRKVTQSL